MSKPSIAVLLSASGYSNYTGELIGRAVDSLYANIGAGLDYRDWDSIMAADNPLEASEAALVEMYQDPQYLIDNADHLQGKGYTGAMIEWTNRQIHERLDIESYDPTWADGTWMEQYAQMSNSEVYNQAKDDVPDPPAPAPASITTDAAGFDTTNGTGMVSSYSADSGTDNTIEIAAAAHLNGTSVVDGVGGTNTVSLTENVSYDLTQGDTFNNVSALSIDTGGSAVSMSVNQHVNVFTTINAAGGSDAITLTDSGTVTGDADIEAYNLAATGNRFTLGAAAQNVTGGAANDTVNVGTLTATGTLDGSGQSSADTLQLGAGSSISGATVSNFETVDVADSGTATMKVAQHNAFATFIDNATQTITLADAGNLTGAAEIETYNLADGGSNTFTTNKNDGQTINAGDSGDNITGGDGVDTITGGIGVDWINGGLGADTLDGGPGNDTFYYDYGLNGGNDAIKPSQDTNVIGGVGEDMLNFNNGNGIAVINNIVVPDADFSTTTGMEILYLHSASGFADVTLAAAANTAFATGIDIRASDTMGEYLRVDGSDVNWTRSITATGSSNNDTLIGGSAGDTLTGGGGVDTIDIGSADTEVDTVNITTGGDNRAIVQNFEAGGTGDKLQVADATFAIANGTLDGAIDILKNGDDQDFNTTDSTTANKTVFAFTNANREITGIDGDGDALTFANLALGNVTVSDMEGAAAVVLNGGGGSSNLAAGENVLIALDDGTSTGIFYAVGDGANLSAEDLQLVGVIDSLANCGDLWEQNFSIV